MSQEHIRTDVQDRICTIRFNRPDKKNAVTTAMYQAMAEALARADQDPNVRVILLAGSAECFTSGNDIMDFLQAPPTLGDDTPVARYMAAMLNAQKPIVAAANGIAIGIGVTVLLHCDLVFVGESTRMQMPFVSIGICPEFGSTVLLPRLMGHQRAAELVMLGEAFTAQTAREYGIVNVVCPDAETETRARAAALKLAQQPPAALRATKKLLKRGTEAVAEAIKIEADHFVPMLRGPEALEALTAFTQKRKPDFSRFG